MAHFLNVLNGFKIVMFKIAFTNVIVLESRSKDPL